MKVLYIVLMCGFLALGAADNDGCELYYEGDQVKLDRVETYNEAKEQFSAGEYLQAYKTLESINDSYSEKEIEFRYKCTKVVPGAYLPRKEVFDSRITHEYDLIGLGKKIRRYLSPVPLVMVQFDAGGQGLKEFAELQKAGGNNDKTSSYSAHVTVANVPQAGALESDKEHWQVPLVNFDVNLGGKSAFFSQPIGYKTQQQRRLGNINGLDYVRITTSEKFGFQTFIKD